MSNWIAISLTILGFVAGLIANALLITYTVGREIGRKTQQYDEFGEQVESMKAEFGRFHWMRNELKWIKAEMRKNGWVAPNGDEN